MLQRLTQFVAITLFISLGWLWPLEAQAQKEKGSEILPAGGQGPMEQVKWGTMELVQVKDPEAQHYRPGSFIEIKLQGNQGNKIGTVVRRDINQKRIFLRTQPNMNAEKIDLQTVASGFIMTYGGQINLGISSDPQKRRAEEKFQKLPLGPKDSFFNEPEIIRLEIMHGTIKTIHYHAPNLSAAERLRLVEMANAENNLMRAEEQGLYTAIIRQEEVNIRREQRNQQELLTQLLYRSLIAPAVLTTHYGYGQIPTDYALGVALARPMDNDLLKTVQKETPNFLKEARTTYTQMRTRAVYEDNRIVAVVAEE